MTAAVQRPQFDWYVSDDGAVGWLEDQAGNVREVCDAAIRRQRLIDAGIIKPRSPHSLTWLPIMSPCLWLHQ